MEDSTLPWQVRCGAFERNDSTPENLMAVLLLDLFLDLIKRFLDLIMQLSGKRMTSFELQMPSKLAPHWFWQRQGAHCPKSRGTAVS